MDRLYLLAGIILVVLQTATSQDVNLNGCDVTKGCARMPDTCTGDDCVGFITWEQLEGQLTRFSMRGTVAGQTTAYISFGMRPASIASGMAPAEVYACTSNLQVERSVNVCGGGCSSPTATKVPGTITEENVVVENNVITCSFVRQHSSTSGDDEFHDIYNELFYVLIALGTNLDADGSITYHDSNRVSAEEPTNLTEVNVVGGAQEPPLQKVHGALMVIAWFGFASIGIIMARFFKPMWPNSKLLGQKVWFTIHRTCMVTALLCFVIGFIVIFVDVKGFVDTSNTTRLVHAVFGIIATFLGIVNPTMALFRPHPGTPNRPIFNWAHYIVGMLAFIIAKTAAFLAVGYTTSLLAGLQTYVFWVLIAFEAFNLTIGILFEVQRCTTESQGRNSDIPLKTSGGASTDHLHVDSTPSAPPGSMAKTILFLVYVTGVVTVVIVVVVSIGIA